MTSYLVRAVKGGLGLVLDSFLYVHQSVDYRRVLSVLRRHVGLLELALLGEHVGEHVLDCRRVLRVLLRHVVLLEPTLLGEYFVKLVLGSSFLFHSISLHRVHN
jgi:hypothetical protein